jgi:catalase
LSSTLRAFENRSIFVLKREEATEECRESEVQKPYDLCSSTYNYCRDKMKEHFVRWAWDTYGGKKNFVRKSEGKRTLGISGRRRDVLLKRIFKKGV